MRNGFLVTAVAAALMLAAPAASHGAAPTLTIDVPPTTGGQLFAFTYTLSPGTDADLIVLELRAPGAADFERYARDPATESGTIGTVIYTYPVFGVVEGIWQVRVTAFRNTEIVANAEGTTRLDFQGGFWVSAPYFGKVPVGVTSNSVSLRVENTLGGPLRIRSVRAPAGSELAVTHDGCAGKTLYGFDGCYVGVTFTPAAPGRRRGTLLIDANSPQKEIYMRGEGLEVPVDPLPQPVVTQAPAPQPAAPAPELTFDAAPGRRSTRLFGLRLDDVPAGSTVTVRCAKGCPAKSYTTRGAAGTVSLRRFTTRALKVGTVIRITLAEPGRPARTATIKIRAGREPRVSGSL